MGKRIISLVVLILILWVPNNIYGDKMKTIIILVDELSFQGLKDLSLNKYCLALMNLKTRPPHGEMELYLSINTGRKLGAKDLHRLDKNLVFLGDILTTSVIGSDMETVLIGDKKGKVQYNVEEIIYEYDWLIENTDTLLNESNLLLLTYEFQGRQEHYNLLKKYIENYRDEAIFVLPKKVAKEDKKILNSYLVPLIYIKDEKTGLLTSKSTKREGFIALEDVSYELKKSYGFDDNIQIGKELQFKEEERPLREIENIYKETMNLLIIAYIFHGLIYLGQGLLGLYILRKKEFNNKTLLIYGFITTNIFTSLLLGLFNLHRYIFIYFIGNLILSFIITRYIFKKGLNIAKTLSILTYGIIVLGILFYPKLIYNSFIGFNNLVYGARYYGLNNGIMGVVLITSIFIFYNINNSLRDRRFKIIFGLFIGMTNLVVLSANIGSNTGGFITSILLFGLIVYNYFFSHESNKRKAIILSILGLGIFSMNMILDNIIGEKTHALELLLRVKANGIYELLNIVYFKLLELLKLALLPPFSLVVPTQIYILKKLSNNYIENGEIKREVMIVIITSLIGFILNDTGVITLIYMLHYLILYLISYDLDMI